MLRDACWWVFSPVLFFSFASQERIIERLKEQRERDDRERLEEIESFRKENKDLKEKVNALQAELTEKEVSLGKWRYHIHSSISHYSKAEYKYKSHLCFYSKTMYYKELSFLEIPERLFGAAVYMLQRIPIACSVFLRILLWRYEWSSYVTYPQLSLPQWFLSARRAHSAGWLKPLCLAGSS